MMIIKRVVAAGFVVLVLLYPLIVYIGIQRLGPVCLAAIIFAAAAGRFWLARGQNDAAQTWVLIVAAGFSALIAISESEAMVKLYPAVMSACAGLVFLLSSYQPQSLIERLARLQGALITPLAKRYTRRLTRVWAVLLLANAAVAAYLAAFASMQWWALYSGLLSYAFFVVFFIVEYGFRRYYIKKYDS